MIKKMPKLDWTQREKACVPTFAARPAAAGEYGYPPDYPRCDGNLC